MSSPPQVRRPPGARGRAPGDLRPRDGRGLSWSRSTSLRPLWGASKRKQTGCSRTGEGLVAGTQRCQSSTRALPPPVAQPLPPGFPGQPHPEAEPRCLCPGCLSPLRHDRSFRYVVFKASHRVQRLRPRLRIVHGQACAQSPWAAGEGRGWARAVGTGAWLDARRAAEWTGQLALGRLLSTRGIWPEAGTCRCSDWGALPRRERVRLPRS